MSGRTLMYIGAVLLFIIGLPILCFSMFYIWASFSPGADPNWITTGIITAIIGLAMLGGGILLIYLAIRSKKQEAVQQVTLNVDLPGDVQAESLKCKSCGGTLAAKDISVVAGAPMVTCPYCNTVYQLTEEPKW